MVLVGSGLARTRTTHILPSDTTLTNAYLCEPLRSITSKHIYAYLRISTLYYAWYIWNFLRILAQPCLCGVGANEDTKRRAYWCGAGGVFSAPR